MGKIDCIESLQGFYDLEREWNELLQNSDADPVFMHPVFLRCWWKIYGDDRRYRLKIIALREQGKLLAIAPLMIKRHWEGFGELRLLGVEAQGQADYGGIIYPAGNLGPLSEIFHYLKNLPGWQSCRLRHISDSLSLASDLPVAAEKAKLSLKKRSLVKCSYLTLPEGYQGLVASRTRKLRYTLRVMKERLSLLGCLEFENFSDKETIAAYLPFLYEQHNTRWNPRGFQSEFGPGKYREFIELLVQDFSKTQILRLFCVALDGCPLAIAIVFSAKKRFYFYRNSFNQEYARFSPGTLLVEYMTETAIAEGCRYVDFLLGDEPYKRYWTSAVAYNCEYRIDKNDLGSRLFNLVHRW